MPGPAALRGWIASRFAAWPLRDILLEAGAIRFKPILLTALAFNLVGEALNEALDPRRAELGR